MIPPKVNETFPYSEGAIWLGRNGDDARTPVGRKDESHVLLCAMNRSAKGRAIITNNLILWPGSVFCNDPKGENASVTAARRGQGSEYAKKFLGQKVCVLDSHHTAKVEDRYRAYYNVLDELDPSHHSTPAKAENIVASFVTDDVKADKTWDEMAVAYMKALILHIVTAPVSKEECDGYIPANERDLITFRRLIQTGDFYSVQALQARIPEEELRQKPPNAQMLLLKQMSRNPAFDGIIADEANNLLESLKLQPKLWNSIRVSAALATKWIDDPEIRKVLRAGTYPNTFRASDLETDPKGVSLYVCLKLEDQKRLAAWPRLITNMVLSAAQTEYFRSPASGHNTLMMLDEFAALERMKSIENAAPAIAGAGVKLFLVLQNLSQMKSVYGENFEAFMANAGTHIYYGFNDNFTAEYVKKRLGEIEVIRYMKQGGTSTGGGTSTSNVEGGGTSEGTSSGTTRGWSPSLFHLSFFTSKQRAKNTNTGTSENWSRTVAEQESKTSTEGWQQQLHKKPLADIHELMQLFGTIDDETEPNFPGIGLISTAEKAPVLIQKALYDRDHMFEGMFDPHPKHGFTPLLPRQAQKVVKQAERYWVVFLPQLSTVFENICSAITYGSYKETKQIPYGYRDFTEIFSQLTLRLPNRPERGSFFADIFSPMKFRDITFDLRAPLNGYFLSNAGFFSEQIDLREKQRETPQGGGNAHKEGFFNIMIVDAEPNVIGIDFYADFLSHLSYNYEELHLISKESSLYDSVPNWEKFIVQEIKYLENNYCPKMGLTEYIDRGLWDAIRIKTALDRSPDQLLTETIFD